MRSYTDIFVYSLQIVVSVFICGMGIRNLRYSLREMPFFIFFMQILSVVVFGVFGIRAIYMLLK